MDTDHPRNLGPGLSLFTLATRTHSISKQSDKARTALVQSSRMYHILRKRRRDSICEIYETLTTMALDARLMPAAAAAAPPPTSPSPDARAIRSTASTPSLRSRDGTLPMLARMDGGGNVRVVVRVRAFLKRGTSFSPQSQDEQQPKVGL